MKTFEEISNELVEVIQKKLNEVKRKINSDWNYKSDTQKERIYNRFNKIQDLLIMIREGK